MSYTYIPTKVKSELWFKAHGRCEICNKPLYRDGLTMQQVNLSQSVGICPYHSRLSKRAERG